MTLLFLSLDFKYSFNQEFISSMKLSKCFFFTFVFTLLGLSNTFAQSKESTVIAPLPNEKWWGAFVGLGHEMPYASSTRIYDLAKENFNNQIVPLMVSNKGRSVWSNQPFQFQFRNDTLLISSAQENIFFDESGKTLKDAYLYASKNYFPASNVIPEAVFFSKPQYNTWIELMYNQNQEDILNYANHVIENDFPAGVFMIDDNWQKYYGNLDFKPEKFPDPKQMVDSLHNMGFDVMLWISPYVSPDSPEFRYLNEKNYLLKDKTGQPAIVKWWNGYSACYDLTNPEAYEYFKHELQKLQKEVGIDGFKFDGADIAYMQDDYNFFIENSTPNDYTEAWAKLGLEFPFNELRTSWKLGGTALVQRLGDKDYSWYANEMLIPQMATAGLLGHAFTCPDMIGGGQYTAFLNLGEEGLNQDLITRSAQIHALMPMMQFSVAPWRVLDKEHLTIVRDAVLLHEKFAPYIEECAYYSAKTGEPIVKSMEFAFPNQGFELVNDQYMLGDKYLVAPMVKQGTSRSVKLPKGKWRDDLNKTYTGGKTIEITVPIDRVPYFEKLK